MFYIRTDDCLVEQASGRGEAPAVFGPVKDKAQWRVLRPTGDGGLCCWGTAEIASLRSQRREGCFALRVMVVCVVGARGA